MKKGVVILFLILGMFGLVGGFGFGFCTHASNSVHTNVGSQSYTQPANRDIVIVFDASESMAKKTESGEAKIDVAKRAVNDFLELMSGDRVGLIVFYNCGDIRTEVDLTEDYNDVSEALQDVFPHDKTPIAESLEYAWEYLKLHGDPQNS
ncbi:MAG: VWA domain-containing protein [Candidatus Methanofastidiosia archaeon]|jgi:Mg-chelatase subunit ChlD